MQPLTLTAPDARADGASRKIKVDRDAIRISRRLEGVMMRVCAPVRQYQGVALALDVEEGRPRYRLTLRHADPELAVTLFEASDDRDVLAEWTGWARFFELPRLVERAPDQIEPVEPRLGAVTLGDTGKLRRRGGSLGKRRPVYPARRRFALHKP